MGETLWINALVMVLLGLGLCCLMAIAAEPLRSAVVSLFAVVYQPLSQIRDTCRTWMQSIKGWLLAQVADESAKPGAGSLYFVIGSVFYTLLTGLFLLCDFGMIVLTAEGMGMDKAAFSLPVDTSTLAAGTLVTAGLFWGSVILDLFDVTHLAPWRKLTSWHRRCLMAISVLMVLLSIAVLVGMAWWRGGQTWQSFVSEAHAAAPDRKGAPSLEVGMQIEAEPVAGSSAQQALPMPDPETSRKILLFTFMGLAALSAASTVFSAWGMVSLCKFLVLFVTALIVFTPLSATLFVSWFVAGLVNGIANAVQRVLDLFIHMGESFLNLFGRRPAGALPGESAPSQSTSAPQPPRGGASADPGFDPFGNSR